MARHSWVNSSMMLSMRNLRPSWVRSSTKSYDQTWLGRSARSRMHDPSFSHRRPRLGCLAGTFSPSRRQIRSTRLSLTSQPAWRSKLGDLAIAVAAILPDQLDDVGRQPCLVVSTVRDLALRRAMLTECRAGTPLGNRQRSSNTRCRRGGARGLVVSPGCLLQDQLVECQIRHRTTQPGVLRFQVLQPLHLVALQPAELLTPTVIRHLADTD